MDFANRMTSVARALDRSPAEALPLVEELETELLAAPSTDPLELGWARDYRIRCLYRLGRHAEGLDVLNTPPARAMALSAKNAAWLHSVGAEMAFRVGAHGQCKALIGRALDYRISAGDGPGAKMAFETGLALLRAAGLAAQVEDWISEAVERAHAADPGSPVAMHLADALGDVARAPWYPGERPGAALRRAELALHAAALAGRAAELRRLLAGGVDPNARNLAMAGLPTPLLAASFAGHVEVVRALLDEGVDLRARNIQGRTALHQAADQDRSQAVALLCAAGAPTEARDMHRQTPLHVAAWQDHGASVEALIAAGAELEARDVNGDTPLALAATEPVPEVVRYLLAAGADREATNLDGQTPLLRAAMSGQAETVAHLLAAGVDVEHRDHHGRSALDWARAEQHAEVVALLLAPVRRPA